MTSTATTTSLPPSPATTTSSTAAVDTIALASPYLSARCLAQPVMPSSQRRRCNGRGSHVWNGGSGSGSSSARTNTGGGHHACPPQRCPTPTSSSLTARSDQCGSRAIVASAVTALAAGHAALASASMLGTLVPLLQGEHVRESGPVVATTRFRRGGRREKWGWGL